jgi:hypothetical protein
LDEDPGRAKMYCQLVQDLRIEAQKMMHPENAETLLSIAVPYEGLAKRIEDGARASGERHD